MVNFWKKSMLKNHIKVVDSDTLHTCLKHKGVVKLWFLLRC